MSAELDPESQIVGLHHVQLAMPRGAEARAETFYDGVLGFRRVAKPRPLEARGGCWFEAGSAVLHLGVEEPFAPARKAHPALLVLSLVAIERRLRAAGAPVRWDQQIDGYERFYTEDPFGNRLELIAPRRDTTSAAD